MTIALIIILVIFILIIFWGAGGRVGKFRRLPVGWIIGIAILAALGVVWTRTNRVKKEMSRRVDAAAKERAEAILRNTPPLTEEQRMCIYPKWKEIYEIPSKGLHVYLCRGMWAEDALDGGISIEGQGYKWHDAPRERHNWGDPPSGWYTITADSSQSRHRVLLTSVGPKP